MNTTNLLTKAEEAIDSSQTQSLIDLLQTGLDVNSRLEDQDTLLIRAAAIDCYDVVNLLVQSGADVDATNDNGETALSVAAINQCLDNFNSLLKLTSESIIPACLTDVIITSILDNDPDVTRLVLQSYNFNLEIRSELIEDEKTVLALAAEWGADTCAHLLIDAGASINAVDINGLTPIHYASKCRSLWEKREEYGTTSSPRLALIKLLITEGANLDCRDLSNRTPLMLAAKWGTSEAVSALLEAGANPSLVDLHNDTVLNYASKAEGSSKRDQENKRMIEKAIFNITPSI